MPDWFYIILAPCLGVVALGAYNALCGYAHHHASAGDHLLSIVQRASADLLDEDGDE